MRRHTAAPTSCPFLILPLLAVYHFIHSLALSPAFLVHIILMLLPIHSLLTHYVDHQEARAAIHNRLLYSVISQDSGSQFMNMNPVCQHICIQPKSSRNGYVTTIHTISIYKKPLLRHTLSYQVSRK
jgi:hypothetical protein